MTLSVVSKTDDATKAIVNASGAENENGTLYSSAFHQQMFITRLEEQELQL